MRNFLAYNNAFWLRNRRKVFGIVILLFISTIAALTIVSLMVIIYDREEIHYACSSGDTKRVDDILSRFPARIEQRNRLELTPLHMASWHGQTETLKLLINRGANVNAKWDLSATGDGNWNSLHIAAIEGHINVAKVLIQAKIEINCKSLRGETPLDIANANGNISFAQYLRNCGGLSGSQQQN